MKILKDKFKAIALIILGIIIGSSITVYATGYLAKDVIYKQGDKEISVQQALNQLYSENGMIMELLWINENPTSDFSSQTISLDLSEYSFVAIDALRTKDSSFVSDKTLIKVGENGWCYGGQVGGYDTTKRTCEVSTIGINFSTGMHYASGNTNNNAYAVPYHIWGIK